MEKKDLEIRKVSEELTAEDLKKVNGGGFDIDCPCPSNCPGKCQKHCGCD